MKEEILIYILPISSRTENSAGRALVLGTLLASDCCEKSDKSTLKSININYNAA